MTELKSELLPVVPLDDAVVLPHMTVPLGIEGDEQQAAIDAARNGNHLVLLVPRIAGKFAAMGTVATVQDSGRLPNGAEVTIVHGEHRARLGSGNADVGGALWVQAEPGPATNSPT